MIIPNPKETIHKAWLYRLLREIYDNKFLPYRLYFKGGTCAAMQDLLDRFSIDLDFDFVGKEDELKEIRSNLKLIFSKLGLAIKDESQKVPQYFLKYPQKEKTLRNTIKIDITFPPPKANIYTVEHFSEIDRFINCQTIETMFANKLVALIDRWEKKRIIAGRDLYDIHYFFIQGFRYNAEVIKERRKISNLNVFFEKLINFIEKRINQKIIDQDLNFLLAPEKFKSIRKILKEESIMFLKDELKRVEKK